MRDFWRDRRIVVTGGAGFLGQAVLVKLLERGVARGQVIIPRSREFDLRRCDAAASAVKGCNMVIHLAASVGGISFNKTYPGRVFYDNTAMALHLIDAAHKAGVEKFIGVGSIVEYPEHAILPLREEHLWDGYPDAANSAYAFAKRCMLAQSQFYRREFGFNAIHLMPVKLYGPGMRVDPENAQVIASLIRKIIEAQKRGRDFIEVWGSGKATREFLYVEDAAEAIVLAAERYNGEEPVNVGSGQETTIKELAETLCSLLDFKGDIIWNAAMPEGQLRSVCDTSRAKELFRFLAKTSLKDGLRRTVGWYKENYLK